jgi:hypothetical protein
MRNHHTGFKRRILSQNVANRKQLLLQSTTKQNSSMESPAPVSMKGGKPPFHFRAASDDTGSVGSRGLNNNVEIDPLFFATKCWHPIQRLCIALYQVSSKQHHY